MEFFVDAFFLHVMHSAIHFCLAIFFYFFKVNKNKYYKLKNIEKLF